MQQESFWDLALNHNKAWNALLYQLILLYFSKEIVCNDIRLGFGFLVCYYCRGTLLIPKDPCVMRHRKKLNQGEKICRKRNHRIFVCTLLDWSIRMNKCLSCPTRNNLACHQNSWCTGNSIEFLYLLPRPVEFIPSLHPGGNKCHHFILSFYRRKGSPSVCLLVDFTLGVFDEGFALPSAQEVSLSWRGGQVSPASRRAPGLWCVALLPGPGLGLTQAHPALCQAASWS